MKPQFKPEEIYLNLSKLSEEQINRLRLEDSDFLEFSDVELFHLQNPEYMILSFNHGKFNISHKEWFLLNDKTELTYSQFLDMMGESEEVLQVENKISIEELTKLCNNYNRNTLKITNLERDLEYKRSWSKESIAIKEIHKEVSHAQAIKENAKSKLQEIGIVF